VSAADRARPDTAGIRLTALGADIVQIAHLRGGAQALAGVATARSWPLPRFGRVTPTPHGVALSVRPGRWLLLSAPASPGEAVEGWQGVCAGAGVAVDLSAAWVALHLAGPAVGEVLARGCRLDLAIFRPGCAAATLVAQVSVILAALPRGVLLLTPATTARHFHEWLSLSALPFGLVPQPDATVALLSGDPLI
jgi:heterotetrameric sarcosine oxidase gamma subunit